MSNNKLIAEFMKLPIGHMEVVGSTFIYEHNEVWFDESELLYHTSWDWLMPVAEKCLTTDEPSDGQHYFINDALLTCNIEVVYDRVVWFIQEYNLTPKKVV